MESSRACLFLAILASASTLTLSAKSDIVVVLTCYAGFEDRIAAGRASRQVSSAAADTSFAVKLRRTSANGLSAVLCRHRG